MKKMKRGQGFVSSRLVLWLTALYSRGAEHGGAGVGAVATSASAAVPTPGGEVDAHALLRELENDIAALDERKAQLRDDPDDRNTRSASSVDASVTSGMPASGGHSSTYAKHFDTTVGRSSNSPSSTHSSSTSGSTPFADMSILEDFAGFDLFSEHKEAEGATRFELAEEDWAKMTESEAILKAVQKTVPYSEASALGCRDHVVGTLHAYLLEKFRFSKLRFLRHGFAHFDANGDGIISEHEFYLFLRSRPQFHAPCGKPKLLFRYVQQSRRVLDLVQFEYVEAVQDYLRANVHEQYLVPFWDLVVHAAKAARHYFFVYSAKAEARMLEKYWETAAFTAQAIEDTEEAARKLVRESFLEKNAAWRRFLDDTFGEGSCDRIAALLLEHAQLDVASKSYFLDLEDKRANREAERVEAERAKEEEARVEAEKAQKRREEAEEAARAAQCDTSSSFVKVVC
ncbi:unnamed protein product [Amoebophrya sp. A25]|nr:unnamed protein product [Amoebophrya sp. A25]|eukprot:GSA25T00023136001.1